MEKVKTKKPLRLTKAGARALWKDVSPSDKRWFNLILRYGEATIRAAAEELEKDKSDPVSVQVMNKMSLDDRMKLIVLVRVLLDIEDKTDG